MKKSILALVISSLCLAVSCKKDEKSTPGNNNNNNNNNTSSYWKLNTTTYKVVKTTKYSDPMLEAADTNSIFPDNYCKFEFDEYPTANGTYKIIDNKVHPKAGEVNIIVARNNDRFYSKAGSASVTVNNGKINIKISAIKVYDISYEDSADFNCDIVQK